MKNKVNILTKTEYARKAQLTLFMLLGLTLLILFAFIFYVSTLQKNPKESSEAQIASAKALQSEALKSYVTSCIGKSLKDGLRLIGEQGGYIYKSEKGSILSQDPLYVSYSGQNYTYLILQPQATMPAPAYPCASEPCYFAMNKTAFPDINRFYFGRFRLLPQLYKYADRITGDRVKINYSIQEQLENYIIINSLDCINISYLNQRPEFSGASLEAGNATADVVFGNDDVSVLFNYPVTIVYANNPPVVSLLKFTANSNIRFKRIYHAVDDMIIKDSLYLDFNLVEGTKEGAYYSENYGIREVLKFNDIKQAASITKQTIPDLPGTDLIVLNDTLSKIDRGYYTFRFARANRRPVLDFIPNIFINQNQAYTVTPRASDPDEDIIIYDYSGAVSSNQFSFANPGDYTIRVTASDGYLEDFQDVNVQVCDSTAHSLNGLCKIECGASPECEGKSPGSLLDTCSFSPYLADMCSAQCIKEQSSICLSGLSCNAHHNCNGQVNSIVIQSGDGKGWCSGLDGCRDFCSEDLVDLDSDNKPDVCGCRPGAACDSSIPDNMYDLDFAGICSSTTPSICEGDN